MGLTHHSMYCPFSGRIDRIPHYTRSRQHSSTKKHRQQGKTKTGRFLSKSAGFLAEKMGFEPMLGSTPTTPLAGEPLRPLGYFSKPNVFALCTVGNWRREWDSNPRMLSHRRFSRPVPSTARPSLLIRASAQAPAPEYITINIAPCQSISFDLVRTCIKWN